MYARRKIYIHANIQVGELRIHERIDAARGSRGNSKARRKTARGDRLPIATGSFSSGLGIAARAPAGLNPAVNSQFSYPDGGVDAALKPRVHPHRDVNFTL